jgi:hypothetical protein
MKERKAVRLLGFYCLFALTSDGRFPLSSLTPSNDEFVPRKFTQRAAFEGRISRVGRGLKLCLLEVSKETSQAGRLPAPSYLPRVNVFLKLEHASWQVDVYTWQVTWNREVGTAQSSFPPNGLQWVSGTFH